MGLEFNSYTIKSPQDLQDALQVEQDWQDFVWQFKSMVDRWGLESATSMLAQALFGSEEFGYKPLIKATHRYFCDPNDYNDYWVEPIKG